LEGLEGLEGEGSTVTVDLEVPVLIVGGGGAGLTASLLLSRLGVESLLVSRYPETSRYPKAHVLNQRSMEIFTDIGVAPAILERSAPTENLMGIDRRVPDRDSVSCAGR
jgi:2,4-dichlorophenol 6-monooxygenase